MRITTSFGQINIISPNIAEIIIHQGIEISLELVEEYEAIMSEYFVNSYAVLVNRVNQYSYAFEALLCVGSSKNLVAAAVINYSAASAQQTKDLQAVRQFDNLSIKEFSGLELGREHALTWLNEQLVKQETSEITQ